MGNICCGPREEQKVNVSSMKKALSDSKTLMIPKECRESVIQGKDTKSENVEVKTESKSPDKSNTLIPVEEEKDQHSKETTEPGEIMVSDKKNEDFDEIKKIIEKVRNGTYIIEALNDKIKTIRKEDSPQKGSSYNEKELKRDENKLTLLCADEDLIKRQRSVLGYIMKKFSLNLLQGKPLTSISFPVQVFEPVSALQRVARTFGYAPNFLKKASETQDPLEQIKLVLSFMIGGLHLNISQRKPFNPILGETYQGILGESPVYMEQVCHHPPISYFLLIGEKYKLHGSFELVAQQGLNSVKGKQFGAPSIDFGNGNVVRFQAPSALLNNILVGKREFYLTEYGYVFCEQSELLCQIKFRSKVKAPLLFEGAIYKVNKNLFTELNETISSHKELDHKHFNHNKDAIETLCRVEGDWTTHLDIDSQRYWTRAEDLVYPLENKEGALPSDSRFRLDSLYLGMCDETTAQAEKELLEETQRKDRALRSKLLDKVASEE